MSPYEFEGFVPGVNLTKEVKYPYSRTVRIPEKKTPSWLSETAHAPMLPGWWKGERSHTVLIETQRCCPPSVSRVHRELPFGPAASFLGP